jgi:hypothetical protein
MKRQSDIDAGVAAMPEAKQFLFTYKELATLLIKAQNIQEGWWGIFVKFGINAANVGPNPDNILPTAIVPILEIGLQRYDKETSLSVDAAVVNPSKKSKAVPKKKSK